MANIEEKKDKELFKKFRDNSEMTALLAIFAGLVFVFAPHITERLIGYLLGSVAIIAGMFFILKYVKKDIKNDFYSHDFVTGVFLIIIGCIIYIRVNVLTDFFQPVLGLIVLYSGVVKLQTALDLMRMKFTTWKMVLILSVVNILISVVLLLRPGFLAKITFLVVGIALIYSGVSSLVASHFFQKGVKKYKKDVDIIDED